MTDLKPTQLSTEDMRKLNGLAEKVYNTPISSLNQKEVLLLIEMDISTSITELSVTCSATRPTEVKFATNNYFVGLKIDVSGIFNLIREKLAQVPQDKLVEEYLSLKSVAYKMLEVKYESTEIYLRNLLLNAEMKDNCPKVGRFNKNSGDE